MKAKKSLIKRILNIMLSVILFILIAVIAITIVMRVSGNTPNLGGYMIFRVSSGSMEPELKIGDVILTKEVPDITSLKKGDIVTYKGQSGDLTGKLITHQVVKAPYKENNTYYFLTKGLANQDADSPVSEKQLVGIMVCKIPFLGELYDFFLTPWGLIAAILLIILAFSGEFWNIYKLSHEKENLPEMSEETIKNAIENYQKEKKSDLKDTDIEKKIVEDSMEIVFEKENIKSEEAEPLDHTDETK